MPLILLFIEASADEVYKIKRDEDEERRNERRRGRREEIVPLFRRIAQDL